MQIWWEIINWVRGSNTEKFFILSALISFCRWKGKILSYFSENSNFHQKQDTIWSEKFAFSKEFYQILRNNNFFMRGENRAFNNYQLTGNVYILTISHKFCRFSMKYYHVYVKEIAHLKILTPRKVHYFIS